ncbi:MAG: hypothetical protein J5940_04950 [Clostridia bacterium]|nr:hypothetical protein [Clostridia bacterium]
MSSKKILSALIALVLCLTMVFSLVACGKTDTPVDSQSESGTNKPDESTGSGDPTPVVNENSKNEKMTLILQESTFDGVYNPFFYSSAYDGDVVGMVNVGLLTVDATGAVVAGPQYDTVAESYTIYYTNDLVNYTEKPTFEEGDYVVYEMVIKNGGKFSDGSSVSADDVLFNYYVLLDPAYVGSSTLYTLPILGLTEYRTQTTSDENAALAALAQKIFEAGDKGYVATTDYTEAQYNTYWEGMTRAGKAFAQEIITYCVSKYPSYATGGNKYSGNGLDLSVEGNSVAFGMAMWGFGSFDSSKSYEAGATGTKGLVDGTYATLYTTSEEASKFYDAAGNYYKQVTAEDAGVTLLTLGSYEAEDAGYKCVFNAYTGERYVENVVYSGAFTAVCTGKNYDMVTTFPTLDDYWENLRIGYMDEDGVVDYDNLNGTESAGGDLVANASENFIAGSANVGSIPNIAGIVKGTKTVDGVEHETVKIILTKQNPKAILSLGVTVAPKAYYTAGYTYTAGALVNGGVELGINGNTKFMDHLKTLNSAPLGAGTYKFVSADGDGVTLVRNEYHYTMGNENVYNATIKNVYLKVVTSGKEYEALEAGDVHYATVSADSDVVEDIAKKDQLTSILVDNLGYGYVCLNPTCAANGLNNLYTRIAYTTVFDLAKVHEYYPSGLADTIYRSQSQVSWAYPEGTTAMYPFDETLATAIEYFKKAGYTFDEATGKFTDVPDMDFYLPSEASDHPAGGIFLRAKELLETIGINANIHVDSNLIADIKSGGIPSYALAWQSSQDPDMYQVYHYQSAAESVISNGIKWLQANGNDDALGTIEVTKLDGSKVTMNQTQAIEYLASLIEEGVKYMSVEERKPIYEKALEVLAQLSIEVPTYQRKNMFAYSNTVIDATTLSATVTPYWGPLAEIWKLSFVNGTAE